jgi:thiol-disulfide isomerase/thioredoxin
MARRLLPVPLVVALVVLMGCSDLQGTDGKQWITGEGKIVQIAPADRGKPVEASGEDLDGDALALSDFRGRVVVANVWASWCPPCRAEMPTVVGLADSLPAEDVAVVGVNIRENGVAAAQSFAREAGIDFPSFYDPSSEVLLGFSDDIGPYSLPSTAVLDRQGRLAAIVLGSIPGRSTLKDLVEDIAAEPGASDG